MLPLSAAPLLENTVRLAGKWLAGAAEPRHESGRDAARSVDAAWGMDAAGGMANLALAAGCASAHLVLGAGGLREGATSLFE